MKSYTIKINGRTVIGYGKDADEAIVEVKKRLGLITKAKKRRKKNKLSKQK